LKKLKFGDIDSFINEAVVLQKLRHPNIVQYLGISFDKNEKYIVMEYLSTGSLDKLLKTGTEKLVVPDLIVLAKQVSAGMMHLESSRVVHRDLALRNILIAIGADGGYVAKISDFGLSRSIENSYYKSEDSHIPIKWSAPEVLEYGTHSMKSDVYSFGVLLWELFSYGETPYGEISNNQARLMILNGNTLSRPVDCNVEMFALMERCWSKTSETRPAFKEIYKEINKMWQSIKTSTRTFKTSNSFRLEPGKKLMPESNDFYGGMRPVPNKPPPPKEGFYGGMMRPNNDQGGFYDGTHPIPARNSATDISPMRKNPPTEGFYGGMKPVPDRNYSSRTTDGGLSDSQIPGRNNTAEGFYGEMRPPRPQRSSAGNIPIILNRSKEQIPPVNYTTIPAFKE